MKKLNSILSGFNKTLKKLEALADANDLAVGNNTAKITSLQQKNLELIAESQAAKNVASNIRKLLEGEE